MNRLHAVNIIIQIFRNDKLIASECLILAGSATMYLEWLFNYPHLKVPFAVSTVLAHSLTVLPLHKGEGSGMMLLIARNLNMQISQSGHTM